MKKVLRVLFRIYDIFAHILGHIILATGIIGLFVFSIYISYQKDQLYMALIEVIIMLVLVILILYAFIRIRGKK